MCQQALVHFTSGLLYASVKCHIAEMDPCIGMRRCADTAMQLQPVDQLILNGSF